MGSEGPPRGRLDQGTGSWRVLTWNTLQIPAPAMSEWVIQMAEHKAHWSNNSEFVPWTFTQVLKVHSLFLGTRLDARGTRSGNANLVGYIMIADIVWP